MRHGRILPREAAVKMARERVDAAMQYERFRSGRGLQQPGVDFVMRAVS
jgi:hypothetical protein